MPDATGVAFIIYHARAAIDCAIYAVWSTAKLQPIDFLREPVVVRAGLINHAAGNHAIHDERKNECNILLARERGRRDKAKLCRKIPGKTQAPRAKVNGRAR